MKYALLSFCAIFLFSCQKEPAIEADLKYEGLWIYHRDAESWMTLNIGSNSKGSIFFVGDGWSGEFATSEKKWYVKNSHLMFGKKANVNETFYIDTPPTVSSTTIHSTYDTIVPGQKYMYLDGNLFVDQ